MHVPLASVLLVKQNIRSHNVLWDFFFVCFGRSFWYKPLLCSGLQSCFKVWHVEYFEQKKRC